MKLSKEEAIRRHRLMWNWIADETTRRGKKVSKEAAFAHFRWGHALMNCWCCEYMELYQINTCATGCILEWPGVSCVVGGDKTNGLFSRWATTGNVKEAADLARQIAELPERK